MEDSKCEVCKSNDGRMYEDGFNYKGRTIKLVCKRCLTKHSEKITKKKIYYIY